MEFNIEYFKRKTLLYYYLSYIACTLMAMRILFYFKVPVIFPLLLLGVMILAICFSKAIINKWFLKKVQLKISATNFSINEFNKQNDEILFLTIPFTDVKNYRITMVGGSSNFYELKIILFSGIFFEYTFPETEQNFLAVKTFYNNISNYSKTELLSTADQLVPGYFSTPQGLMLIKLYIIIFIIVTIVLFFIHPKTSYASLLISFSILIQLFSTRKSQINLIQKLKNE